MQDRAPARTAAQFRLLQPALALAAAVLCAFALPRVSAVTTPVPAVSKSVDAEFKTLQAREEDARQDMSRWLAETAAHDEHLEQKPHNFLSARMEHRGQLISAAFAAFQARHPGHGPAAALERAFQDDLQEDLEAIRQWEEGRLEDSASAAPWNELAHYLTHNGRVSEAFACFEKSLSLGPTEAVYYFDYATAMLLYRTDAARVFKLTEQAVFDKVLVLYRRGMRLEPGSFDRAADFAKTFYVVTPARRAEGLAAWHHAYTLASTDAERDEVRTHLARYAILAQHLGLARLYLDQVHDPRQDVMKESLLRRISDAAKAEKPASSPTK